MPHYYKKYLTCDVVPGMMLAQPVISKTGSILLTENTILTRSMIDHLRQAGIYYLDVVDFSAAPKSPVDTLQKRFEGKHHLLSEAMHQAFERARQFKHVPLQELTTLTNQSLEMVNKSAGILTRLSLLDRKDRYTFIHSVNVGVTAGIIGKWLGFQGDNLKDLVLAGFLHDIGKTQIPPEILNKPGKLSFQEMEIMRKHTNLGYDLIRQTPGIPLETKLATLQHHEKLDGTGYPLKLSNNRIGLTAQIIAVADIYDALTSNRVYRQGMTPFEVIRVLLDEMYAGKIAPRICSLFINYLQESLVGVKVQLNNGQAGKIIHIDRVPGSVPIVATTNGEFINMNETRNIHIKQMLRA